MTSQIPVTPPNQFGGTFGRGSSPPLGAASSTYPGGPVNFAPGTSNGQATAASAHNMLKALGLELGFVVVATMVAGVSETWATSMVALMLALLVLRGLFEVDLFAAFAQGTQLRPATPIIA